MSVDYNSWFYYGSSSTFIWQRNTDTEKERLEQNSSGRDEIFKNS
jgi:hypothetical protein